VSKGHAALTPERWAEFTLDQQLLMIANEMNRAGKILKPEYRAQCRGALERALALTDLTIGAGHRSELRRELLRWRDRAAAEFIAESPNSDEFAAMYRTLLQFTATTWRQAIAK
jgi:hypothetical protein